MKQPHYLVQDDDGHWYLIPESYRERFEEVIGMNDEAPARELTKMMRYAVDGPQAIRILEWEVV